MVLNVLVLWQCLKMREPYSSREKDNFKDTKGVGIFSLAPFEMRSLLYASPWSIAGGLLVIVSSLFAIRPEGWPRSESMMWGCFWDGCVNLISDWVGVDGGDAIEIEAALSPSCYMSWWAHTGPIPFATLCTSFLRRECKGYIIFGRESKGLNGRESDCVKCAM